MAYCVQLIQSTGGTPYAAGTSALGAGFVMFNEQNGVVTSGLSQVLAMSNTYNCQGAVLLQGSDWTQYQSYLAATTVDPTVCAQFFAFGITIVVPAYLVSHYAGAITRFISGFLR